MIIGGTGTDTGGRVPSSFAAGAIGSG